MSPARRGERRRVGSLRRHSAARVGEWRARLRRRHRERLLHGLQIVAVCEAHGQCKRVSLIERDAGMGVHASSARWMAQSVACTMITSDMATPLLCSVAAHAVCVAFGIVTGPRYYYLRAVED